jgi:hypothetical protein
MDVVARHHAGREMSEKTRATTATDANATL